MKSRPVGAELFQADGRKDMTKLIVAFRNSVNAPKKWKWCLLEKVTCWMKVGRQGSERCCGRTQLW
jgi:hypothetical protein